MTPIYRILADKQDVTQKIANRLVKLTVTDRAGQQSDAFTMELDDRDDLIELPRTGARLEVALGYEETGLTPMGIFTVDEVMIAGPKKTITVKARSADFRDSLKARKNRSFENITIRDLVATIASEHGLKPRISIPLQNIAIAQTEQTNESDLHLLTRLANTYDAVAKPVNGFLVFALKGQAKTTSGLSIPSISINRSQTTSYSFTLSERGKYGSVEASYYDEQQAEGITVIEGEGEPAFRLRHNFDNDIEAANAARAKLKSLNRGNATGSIELAIGDPQLAAENKVQLSDFRSGIDGEWVVDSVEHLLSSGFASRLQLVSQ